ncbi:hypothetical protein MGN70_009371 [Eutypa lata]|nr:hypothetical protein MGN70_009371 [Eutypa lata]
MHFSLSLIIGALLVVSGMAMALPKLRHNRPKLIHHDTTPDGEIPLTEWGCTGHQLDECAVQEAKGYLVEYGKKFSVPRRTLKYWHNENRTASWWICNCKLAKGDPLVADEFEQVLDILEDKCGGRYRSGWVWSKEWKKTINVGLATDPEGDGALTACPSGCFEAGNENNDT